MTFIWILVIIFSIAYLSGNKKREAKKQEENKIRDLLYEEYLENRKGRNY